MNNNSIALPSQNEDLSSFMRGLIHALKARGTTHVFGTPIAATCIGLIEAIRAEGLTFIATQSETAAAIMASVQAEITGSVGALLTPGAQNGGAAAVNGLVFVFQENLPLLAITPSFAELPPVKARSVDQQALFATIVKEGRAVSPKDGLHALDHLLTSAVSYPAGPVHAALVMREGVTSVMPDRTISEVPGEGTDPGTDPRTDPNDLDRARSCLDEARKPVLVIGMDARAPSAVRAANEVAARLGCPVLTTDKSKGVVSDRHPFTVGQFNNGVAEADILNGADLIIVFGLDPREMVDRPWDYQAPVLEIAAMSGRTQPFRPNVRIAGALALTVDCLDGSLARKNWSAGEMTAFRVRMHSRFVTGQQHRRSAKTVIETAKRLSVAGTLLVVDGGPHMLSALAFWPAETTFGVLKPQDGSVLGYALPAAIAASLLEPDRPTLVVTSYDSLMACLSELATAVRLNSSITILVMNDRSEASVNQTRHEGGGRADGEHDGRLDFAVIARGFGLSAWSAGVDDALGGALSEALACQGPSLVDAMVDPKGYAEQRAAVLG